MTIARDWNTRGVPGASDSAWTAPTLRKALLSSRMVGLREHGVDPSGKTLGDLSPAIWPAAIDRHTWDQIRAILLNPERNTNVRKAGSGDDGTMGRTLAGLGAAQSRPHGLDDDFYVHGTLAEGRYKSIRVKLEREIDRLHALVDAATKQRIVLHPDPRAFWAEADFHQRRDLVRLMVQRVEVMPGRPAVRRFNASRVAVGFRERL